MSLVGQWREHESALPAGWETVHLRLGMVDVRRAAALLGPAQPYLDGKALRFDCARDGSAPGPDQIVRLLGQLDRQRITGRLELVGVRSSAAAPEPESPSLAESWDDELARVPADWSDLVAEIVLLSTDYIERASLLCAPLNLRLEGRRTALRFRAAASFGYGASPGMVRRCLERCDADEIRGSVKVLHALSDTHSVANQGPVWLISGETV